MDWGLLLGLKVRLSSCCFTDLYFDFSVVWWFFVSGIVGRCFVRWRLRVVDYMASGGTIWVSTADTMTT